MRCWSLIQNASITGIPSPDRLQKSEMHQNQIVSPLIHSVPLLFENNNSGEHR